MIPQRRQRGRIKTTAHSTHGRGMAAQQGYESEPYTYSPPIPYQQFGQVMTYSHYNTSPPLTEYQTNVAYANYMSSHVKTTRNMETQTSSRDVNDPESKWFCHKCDKSYTHRRNLDRHDVRVHGAPTHMCMYCGKSFVLRTRLAAHLMAAHLTDNQA